MNIAFQPFLQLLLAAFLGALLGLERRLRGKEAGLRTFALVALGSCLFTIISNELFYSYIDLMNKPGIGFDPSRVILAVATGLGFIGAGVIIYRQAHIEGLTTAAGLWTVAALGVAIGVKLYFIAFIAALLTIFILIVFGELERILFKKD